MLRFLKYTSLSIKLDYLLNSSKQLRINQALRDYIMLLRHPEMKINPKHIKTLYKTLRSINKT